jgi:hypothetical protein
MSYSSDDIASGNTKEGDNELQEFLLMEKQKAQLNAQVLIQIENSRNV